MFSFLWLPLVYKCTNNVSVCISGRFEEHGARTCMSMSVGVLSPAYWGKSYLSTSLSARRTGPGRHGF